MPKVPKHNCALLLTVEFVTVVDAVIPAIAHCSVRNTQLSVFALKPRATLRIYKTTLRTLQALQLSPLLHHRLICGVVKSNYTTLVLDLVPSLPTVDTF